MEKVSRLSKCKKKKSNTVGKLDSGGSQYRVSVIQTCLVQVEPVLFKPLICHIQCDVPFAIELRGVIMPQSQEFCKVFWKNSYESEKGFKNIFTLF